MLLSVYALKPLCPMLSLDFVTGYSYLICIQGQGCVQDSANIAINKYAREIFVATPISRKLSFDKKLITASLTHSLS